jgi:uncharacterized protein YjbI with pentapeptide repeats
LCDTDTLPVIEIAEIFYKRNKQDVIGGLKMAKNMSVEKLPIGECQKTFNDRSRHTLISVNKKISRTLAIMVGLIATVLAFQNFSKIEGPRYDIKRGLCVQNQNGTEIIGMQKQSDVFSDCHLVIAKDLTSSIFARSEYSGVTIIEGYAQNTNWSMSHLSGLSIMGSHFARAVFRDSEIKQTQFHGTDFTAANFSNAQISGGIVKESNLSNSNLSSSKWGETVFENNDFTNANLNLAKFEQISLRGKLNLTGAKLMGASISFSNWQKLAYLNLDKADLRGADLSQLSPNQISQKPKAQDIASLISARGAIYDSTTKLPFSELVAKQIGMIKERGVK